MLKPPITGWRFWGGKVQRDHSFSQQNPIFTASLFFPFQHPEFEDGDNDDTDCFVTSAELPPATCRRGEHPAPDDNCSCGWRMVTDLDELLDYVGYQSSPLSGWFHLRNYLVISEVRTDQEVCEQVVGDDPPSTLRAATLAITKLYLGPGYARFPRTFERQFGVPVEVPQPYIVTNGIPGYDFKHWIRQLREGTTVPLVPLETPLPTPR